MIPNRYGRGLKKPRPKHRPASPTPAELVTWRERLDFDHAEAAALIYYGFRAWDQWERGTRIMHPALYELFAYKAGKLAKRREAAAIQDRERPALLRAAV